MVCWICPRFLRNRHAAALYLKTTLHATDTQWGERNAIVAASFIPTFAAFGVLCTRVSLRKLLAWETVIGVPQMIPLLFTPSVNDTLIAAVPMGLMGGAATATYMALLIRSCPPGLEGTVMMMSGAVGVVAVRLGDVLGTRLYDPSRRLAELRGGNHHRLRPDPAGTSAGATNSDGNTGR